MDKRILTQDRLTFQAFAYDDTLTYPMNRCTDSMTQASKPDNKSDRGNNKFRTLFEQSLDAIYITDPGGSAIEANQAWLDLFGYTREELPVLKATDLYADPAERETFLRRIRETGFVKDEVRFRRKDGTVIDCERTVTALRDESGNVTAYQGIHRDITERRRAEQALQESEQYNRSIVEVIPDIIIRTNAKGEYLDIIASSDDKLYAPKEDLLGKSIVDVLSDEDAVRALGCIETALATESLQKIEYQLELAGENLWFEARFFCAGGKEAIALIRDVTDQKLTLEELRESQERFEQLAEQSRTFAWEVDTKARYTYVSDLATKIIGYRPEELVGIKHFYDLHPQRERQELKELGLRLIRSGEKLTNFENPIVSKDGRILWVSSNGVPLLGKKGEVVGYRGWDMDITQRRQAEDALRDSEQRFRSLFEQSRDAIYLGTLDGAVIDVNQAWLELFGYTREELPSVNAVHFYANPNDRADFLRRLIETGAVEDEVRFRRKDGSEFDCERTVVARRDRHGNVVAVQGIMRDITRQKHERSALEHLARYDPLTGLFNRHSILEKLREWILHSMRYRAYLSVAMIDIDHFKIVNDSYGHAAGDRVLAALASLLQQNVRSADFVGRYGGEEFLVILPRTNIDGAVTIAERLRSTVEDTPLHARDDTTLHLTISLGVAQWSEEDSEDPLLARVDAALYHAKEGGRNRIEVAPSSEQPAQDNSA